MCSSDLRQATRAGTLTWARRIGQPGRVIRAGRVTRAGRIARAGRMPRGIASCAAAATRAGRGDRGQDLAEIHVVCPRDAPARTATIRASTAWPAALAGLATVAGLIAPGGVSLGRRP